MRSLAWLVAAVFVVGWLSSSGVARADVPAAPASAPSPGDMSEARRHFSVGNDLYKDGRHKDALLEFDAAYRLSGRPAALLNVADCQRQLNLYVEAYDTYQAVLARHGAQLSAADKTAVQRAIEYLDAHTGQLMVTCSVGDAEVLVDERPVGRTPLPAPLRLDIGTHNVVVHKDGFVPFTPPAAVVQVLSKQLVTVEAKLAAEIATGHLGVREQSGREVHVLVDNVDKGPAPWEGDLPPGAHTVEAKGDRFTAAKQSVELGKGQRLDLVVSAEPTMAHLRIVASPAEATIEVDHQRVGDGSWEGDVAPGLRHIEVVMGSVRASREVTVERGATVLQEIPLDVHVEKPPEYEGLYGRVNAIGALGQSHDYFSGNGGDAQRKPTFGGGALGALGYDFGLLSLELDAAFLLSQTSEGQISIPMRNQDVYRSDLGSVNGFVGTGVRLTPPSALVRFTAGAAIGAAIRSFSLQSNPSGEPGGFDKSAGYVAPALLFDIGLSMGGTPGPKFVLGLVVWLDFPTQDVVVGPDTFALVSDSVFTAPGRGYLLASGPQLFFGPTLGVQFGH